MFHFSYSSVNLPSINNVIVWLEMVLTDNCFKNMYAINFNNSSILWDTRDMEVESVDGHSWFTDWSCLLINDLFCVFSWTCVWLLVTEIWIPRIQIRVWFLKKSSFRQVKANIKVLKSHQGPNFLVFFSSETVASFHKIFLLQPHLSGLVF